jgi:hypothetical protein
MEYEILVEVTKKLKLIRESYEDLNQELCDNYPQLQLEMSEALEDSYEYYKCRNAIDRLLDLYLDDKKITLEI